MVYTEEEQGMVTPIIPVGPLATGVKMRSRCQARSPVGQGSKPTSTLTNLQPRTGFKSNSFASLQPPECQPIRSFRNMQAAGRK